VTADVVGVLDTSTLVLIDRIDREALPRQSVITAITLAELSVGPLTASDPGESAARQIRLQEAESMFEPLPFDAPAARAFGVVSAALRQSGRKTAARAFDAMIAAVAVANDLPLYTCNARDFAGIDGLRVHAIRHPDDPAAPAE
jgi:tRNA(fMet)-specific endonuclease VapC